MKRLLLYDLDGTIVDTREDIAIAANHMITSLGGEALPQAEVEKFVGRGVYYLIKGCLKTEDMKLAEKGFKLYRDHYQQHMLDNTDLYPGALDFLKRFSDRTQAVITNKPDPFSTEMLDALKVSSFFVKIVAGEGEFPKKPDPTSTLKLMEASGVSPQETVFIGDSAIDIETARNAGVEIVVISHGFTGADELQSLDPDAVVSDFEGLRTYAEEKQW